MSLIAHDVHSTRISGRSAVVDAAAISRSLGAISAAARGALLRAALRFD